MLVAYFCGKGSSMTPITKYMNNEIKPDMIKEKNILQMDQMKKYLSI